MTGLFSSKNDVFSSITCQFYKKQYFYNPVRVSLAILMQIKKKKFFLFQLQNCVSSSAYHKKTRCRRMAPVPPFWDICQWQNFPGNLNTWPNTSSKRFFLLPFLQPKKNVKKSMQLHWCCSLSVETKVVSEKTASCSLLTTSQCWLTGHPSTYWPRAALLDFGDRI